MDFTKETRNSNPMDKSTPFGILFFTYTFGMFKKGYQKTLEGQDLYSPIKSDHSQLLGDRLERAWNNIYEKAKKKNKKPSLLLAFAKAFWHEQLILGMTLVCWQASSVAQPLLTTFAIFQALRLSKTALGETASGKIVNFLSNDVSRFDVTTILIHHMWVAPLTAIIITFLTYNDVGWPGVVSIGIAFLVVPLQGHTGKLAGIYRKATALKTDERIRLMDEILSGIQVIKMYAWEKPFAKLIRYARKAELKIITKSSYLRGVYMTFNMFTSRVSLFGTFVALALTDQEITASKL